ncbi:segregation/condensation protein A [Candidatus Fermentibacteria bacterium]|nr:MAG: segregation/condensation protein A [Candidatus Fermentibacteria bacterium]
MSAENSTACRIALDEFEGPLDLLLYLIRRNEMDITAISVAVVADQYLAYIRAASELDLDIAGEYLVMAATLARMKSRSLLPVEQALMEESEDPMETLMRHIVLYRVFKEVAGNLRENETVWRDVFSFPGERERYEEAPGPPDPGQTSLLDLLLAVESMTEKQAAPPDHRVRKPLMSLSECVDALEKLLPPGKTREFRETIGKNAGRDRVVSFFVALLELMKRGWVVSRQGYPLGSISIKRTKRWTGNA